MRQMLVTLQSGRSVPIPKNIRGTRQGLAKLDAWLLSSAITDAHESLQDFPLTLFKGMSPKRLSTADRDMLNDYLFGSDRGISLLTGARL